MNNNRTIFQDSELTQYFMSEGYSFEEAILNIRKQQVENWRWQKNKLFKWGLKIFTTKSILDESKSFKDECKMDICKTK